MSSWKPAKLGDIAETCLGKMLDKEKNKGEPKPYLANIDVRWGSFDLSNLSTMRFEESETERYGLKNGDLVICEGGEPGRCAIWRDQLPQMMIQKALHRVRANSNFSNEFIFYRLLLAGRRGELDKYFIGSTIKHLTGFTLKQIEFDYPELTEQKKIAAVLSALDAKIELNQRMNEELEGMAKLLYDYWFVQYDFPMSAAQAAALGKPHLTGHPYRASGGPMTYHETLKREIPKGWEVGAADALFDFNPTTKLKDGTVAGYFDMDAVLTRGFMTKKAQRKAFSGGTKFMNGDVVVARITPCLENGKTALITQLGEGEVGFGSTEFIVLRGKTRSLSAFGACLARSETFRKFAITNMTGTSGRKRIDAPVLKTYPMSIPPTELLVRFEEVCFSMFQQMTLNEQQTQELTTLRDWLLPMLMNGQLTVG